MKGKTMHSLLDELLGRGVTNEKTARLQDQIDRLTAENQRLRQEVERYQKAMTVWVSRCADLSRRLGKVKIQLIDLQIRSN